ncbi:MAG: hypothetical protein ABF968_14485 [Acetobacter sp.]|uniref:hypothetical protein n=1 Tax=Acetobacter sp. TaxID=440 RepID=UPI0039EBFD9C
MAENDALFEPSSGKAPEKRPVRKGPTFTPFVVAAALLVIVWAVMTFAFPGSPDTLPASTILKNTLHSLTHDDVKTEQHQ